jgi:hypothetical protein
MAQDSRPLIEKISTVFIYGVGGAMLGFAAGLALLCVVGGLVSYFDFETGAAKMIYAVGFLVMVCSVPVGVALGATRGVLAGFRRLKRDQSPEVEERCKAA